MSCGLVVSVTLVIGSEQASAFGIPNPLLGIFGFGALIFAGMSLLAGEVLGDDEPVFGSVYYSETFSLDG